MMPKSRAFFWRMIYAAMFFVFFWWLFPMFLDVISISPGSQLITFIKACSAVIAVLYVFFGPAEPPALF